MVDPSNGYDRVAGEFIKGRGTSGRIGVSTVRDWARDLPAGASVLDLGCGPGYPISRLLVDEGFTVYGVDASPKMITEFRSRFPGSQSECESVEASRFFDRTFDAVVAWGLMFLLSPTSQATLIRKVAAALSPGGSFLFTAPPAAIEWVDILTGCTSVSLGAESYRQLLQDSGLLVVGERSDEGDNHYYIARKA